jgi:hypothetical protein
MNPLDFITNPCPPSKEFENDCASMDTSHIKILPSSIHNNVSDNIATKSKSYNSDFALTKAII